MPTEGAFAQGLLFFFPPTTSIAVLNQGPLLLRMKEMWTLPNVIGA